MRLTVLTSGSKGNCSYVEAENTRLLLDIGLSYHRLKQDLESQHANLDDIDALLLTHTHKDHILGLEVTIKHTNFKVYITEEMYKDLKDIVPKERIEFYHPDLHIQNIKVTTIKTSHDAKGSVGFLLENGSNSLVYITDTGYIHHKYLKMLTNKQIYYIESNHDEKMLMDGPYPFQLKQRIISDEGHLSNEMAASYLEQLVGIDTKYVLLAHLSEHNNTKEKALEATENHLANTPYHPIVLIAEEKEITELVEVV